LEGLQKAQFNQTLFFLLFTALQVALAVWGGLFQWSCVLNMNRCFADAIDWDSVFQVPQLS